VGRGGTPYFLAQSVVRGSDRRGGTYRERIDSDGADRRGRIGGSAADGDGAGRSGYLDQRVARGIRTRSSIIEAMIDLIVEGHVEPTSRQVAHRAGVSVRLVFHHFGDLDQLFTSAAAHQASRSLSLIAILPPHGPVETRIRLICRQRRQLFEANAPLLRASYARSPGSTALTDSLADHRSILRRQLDVTLAPEINARGPKAPVVLDALDVAAGWHTWSALRFDAGHSAASAEQVMVFSVTRLLL
jgi:AcrR family transcriptional regulator